MKSEVVNLTKVWIERFVIGLKLCPFAHFSYYDDTIYYEISKNNQLKECQIDLLDVILKMKVNGPSQISNAFLIFEQPLSFGFLLELKERVDTYLEDSSYQGIFQSVVFHPEFQFADEKFIAAGNFINRSPYPMVHILRVNEVSRAIDATPNVEEIPYRNKKVLEDLNLKRISEVFEDDFIEKIKSYI